WYAAPDRFRRSAGPASANGLRIPGDLVVNGPAACFVPGPGEGARGPVLADPVEVAQELSAFDLFSVRGFLRRAAGEKHARVREAVATLEGRRVSLLSVTVIEPDLTQRWRLWVEPGSARVLSSNWVTEVRGAGARQLTTREVLQRFDYNRPLPQGLFDLR